MNSKLESKNLGKSDFFLARFDFVLNRNERPRLKEKNKPKKETIEVPKPKIPLPSGPNIFDDTKKTTTPLNATKKRTNKVKKYVFKDYLDQTVLLI
ncbi:hypothetical protein N9O82_01835 [Methylophilaceae bacterium]|nr:hypothetical protein [Methylophilaceae bacterium]